MKSREEIEEIIEFYKEDVRKAYNEYDEGIISKKLLESIRLNHITKIEALKWVLEGEGNE